MRTRIAVGIVAGALLLSGVGLAAAESESLKTNATEIREACKPYRDAGDKAAFRDCVKEHVGDRVRGHGRHRDRPHAPPFAVENGTVTGQWVSFSYDAATGALSGYTSHGPMSDVRLLDAVTVAEHDGSGRSGAKGGAWVGLDPEIAAVAFNAPNAGLFLATKTGNVVTFDVADGFTVTVDGTNATLAYDDAHAATIRLRGNGTVELVDADTVVVTIEDKGGVAYSIDGYPRMLHREAHAVKALLDGRGERAEGERDAAPEGARPEREARRRG